MRTSEHLDLFSGNFRKAQKELKKAIKDSDNPFFKSKYADLEAVFDACREALLANGITVMQGGECQSHGWVLTTRLLDNSGQWIESDYPLTSKDMNDPQKIGSSWTYARRYSLAAMAGVVTEDDDGNKGAESHDTAPLNVGTASSVFKYDPNYTIPFGKKHLGKKLADLTSEEIVSYRNYLLDNAEKDRKPLGKMANDFVLQADAYLAMGMQEIEDTSFDPDSFTNQP